MTRTPPPLHHKAIRPELEVYPADDGTDRWVVERPAGGYHSGNGHWLGRTRAWWGTEELAREHAAGRR